MGKDSDEEVAWRCQNPECPAKLTMRGCSTWPAGWPWTSRAWARPWWSRWWPAARFAQPWEVFRLLEDPAQGLAYLAGLERMGEKSAQNLMAALDAARTAPLARWIHALGIPMVGASAPPSCWPRPSPARA